MQYFADPSTRIVKAYPHLDRFKISTEQDSDGVLTIAANVSPKPAWSENLPYASRMINTYGTFSQTYGYIEIMAQVPSGQGLWPALWKGLQAFRRSGRYRLTQAEQRLRRLIYRREVRVILTDADGSKRDIDDRARLDPTLAFDPKKDRVSVTRKGRRVTWGFETDALHLVGALETKLPWRGNNTANDWLRPERYLRELFETKGVPSTRQTYFAEAAIW